MTQMTLHFGPQHPSAHGVLHVELTLEGETIVGLRPDIGYLHRGIEKILEHKTYEQGLPYFDRLDYLSPVCNEHVFVLAQEKMLGITPPLRAQYIRVLFSEITRILNHLLWLGAMTHDVGVMSLFLYCLEEREHLLDVYETTTGSRMHANYFCVGGVRNDLPDKMMDYVKASSSSRFKTLQEQRKGSVVDFLRIFCETFPKHLEEYRSMLDDNPIFQQRTQQIGSIPAERALELGFTGPMLRASGVEWDLRKNEPYEIYSHLKWTVPVGKNGDCYDRYQVRMIEMEQSCLLIQQCLDALEKNTGPIVIENSRFVCPDKTLSNTRMDAMVARYQWASVGYFLPPGHVYQSIEHPKGEMGVFLFSDGANHPYRVKIRPPDLPHLAALSEMAEGHLFSDLVAILSSLDIVFGSIDR